MLLTLCVADLRFCIQLAIDTACLFEIAFRCRPPRALWDVSAGVCPNSQANLVLGYLTGSKATLLSV